MTTSNHTRIVHTSSTIQFADILEAKSEHSGMPRMHVARTYVLVRPYVLVPAQHTGSSTYVQDEVNGYQSDVYLPLIYQVKYTYKVRTHTYDTR